MAYYMTINIEKAGTPTSNGKKSKAGHMWYSLKDSSTNDEKDYGFTSKDVDGDGKNDVSNTDRDDYEGDPAYSRTVEVTKEQYDAMKAFGDDDTNPYFDYHYNVMTNSCVDYVYFLGEILYEYI